MQIGIVGLGRMGNGITRRLLQNGHECVVYDTRSEAVAELAKAGASGAASLDQFVQLLETPRIVWLMLPAGAITDAMVEQISQRAVAGDIIIDGGNSFYRDDMRRAEMLRGKAIHYVDVGTSGGLFGLERGFCLMVGGETKTVEPLTPIFASLAPKMESAPGPIPTANMWCAHTPKPRKAIRMIE